MASLNKAMLIGRLGQDVNMNHTAGGMQVANFTMATDESYKDKDGQKVERTEWHRVVAWGKLAELCSTYLRKGSMCHVEGKLQTRKWQDKDGQDRYTTEIVAQNVIFLTPRSEQSGGYGGAIPAPTSNDAPGGYQQYANMPADPVPF